MADPNKKISIDHHINAPTDGSKCLLCLDPLTAPFLEIKVGETWRIRVDDECWDQLSDMVDNVREAHKSKEGVIMH